MHIIDFAASIDVLVYLPILLCVFLLCILLFRKESFGMFDPIWITVMAMAFGITNIVYFDSLQGNLSSGFVPYLGGTILAFAMGSGLVRGILHRYTDAVSSTRFVDPFAMRSAQNRRLANCVIAVASTLLLLAILVRATTVGLPIFGANPETEKVSVNSGGFGLLQRVIEPCIFSVLLIVFYLTRITGRVTRLRAVCLLISIAALLVSGAKGALLAAYQAFFFANVYVSLRIAVREKVSLKATALAAVAIVGYAFVVLALRAISSAEESVSDFVVSTFFVRLVAYGDGIYYYFVSGKLFEYLTYSPVEYAYRYWLIPILAPLRLLPYQSLTLGSEIATRMFQVETRGGPNPTMAVEGYVFFGYFGGICYCGVMGAAFAWFRRIAVCFWPRRELIQLLIFGFANTLALRLPADSLLFMGGLFDTVSTMSIVLFGALVLRRLLKFQRASRLQQRSILSHASA